eukprot:gene11050-11205_t
MHGHFEGPVDPIFIPALSEQDKAEMSADEHDGDHSDSFTANKEAPPAPGPTDQKPSQAESSSTQTPAAASRCAGNGHASFIFRGVIRAPVQRSGEALRQHVRALQQHLFTQPPREAWWLLQIAQAYEEAGYKSLALQHHSRAFKASRSRSLAAWAMYSLSVMHTAAAQYPAVIDAASRGISKVPTPELLWIASFASYSMGNMQQAVAWAEMAASLGCMRKSSSSLCSIPSPMVFMDLNAWYGHPYDVLAYSYKELGDASAASEAEATRSFGGTRLKELLTAAHSGDKQVVVAGLQALATQEGQDLFEAPAAAQSEPKVAASMTTAHRPQLFRRSWHSFRSRCLDCDSFVKQWYIVDDGSNQDDLQQMQSSAPPCAVSWLDKGQQFAGHAGSLNRLLEEVFEQGFDYLLHLEDDWWFMRDENFISKALSVMEVDPSIIQVLFNPDYRDLDVDWEEQELHANRRYITADGVPYALHKYAGSRDSEEYQRYLVNNKVTKLSHLHWPGFSLRPGLWRLSAVKQRSKANIVPQVRRPHTTNGGPNVALKAKPDSSSTLPASPRLQQVLDAIDALNEQDPRRVTWQGKDWPYELAYSHWLTDWVLQLEPEPSEVLRIVARGQHVERWKSPRSGYPDGKTGYFQWRENLKASHAATVTQLMQEAGYDEASQSKVTRFILKKDLKKDPENQAGLEVVEDALCLVFLQHQFAELLEKEGPDKMVSIVQKTWGKMGDKGREAALKLNLPDDQADVVARALAS